MAITIFLETGVIYDSFVTEKDMLTIKDYRDPTFKESMLHAEHILEELDLESGNYNKVYEMNELLLSEEELENIKYVKQNPSEREILRLR